MSASPDNTKKEALFNEVKGSLFEYLVGKNLSQTWGSELEFQNSIDRNYLAVLSQQDRMVRQFYPDMLLFLQKASQETSKVLMNHLGVQNSVPRLLGKISGNDDEADIIISQIPVSLKLNKKSAFVNTKSGGIKSFFSQYFGFIPTEEQEKFNRFVDMEFSTMAHELHSLHDLEFDGTFAQWTRASLSELPGELSTEDRDVLKAYYSRIARKMHEIFTLGMSLNPEEFKKSLAPLMGFKNQNILQVVCFHEFKHSSDFAIEVHPFAEVSKILDSAVISPFGNTSSVELKIRHWTLQIRVKPMNKFTTTAIKINCSVRVTKP